MSTTWEEKYENATTMMTKTIYGHEGKEYFFTATVILIILITFLGTVRYSWNGPPE